MAAQQGCIGRFFRLFGLAVFMLVGFFFVVNLMIGDRKKADPAATAPMQPVPAVVQDTPPEPPVNALAEPEPMVSKPAVAEPVTREPTIEELVAKANAARPIIPGLLAADVHLNLTNRGFTLKSRMGNTQCEWLCGKEMPWGRMDVDCFGPNPNALWSVRAIVASPANWETEQSKAARELFPFIATLPYEGAQTEAAAKWVAENVGQNATQVFGPCQFELIKAAGHVLEITAVEK